MSCITSPPVSMPHLSHLFLHQCPHITCISYISPTFMCCWHRAFERWLRDSGRGLSYYRPPHLLSRLTQAHPGSRSQKTGWLGIFFFFVCLFLSYHRLSYYISQRSTSWGNTMLNLIIANKLPLGDQILSPQIYWLS